jgi:hypothetical protein
VQVTGHKKVVMSMRAARILAKHGGGGGGGDAGGGGGGGSAAASDLARRLREAAEIIAKQARVNASGWSARIPPSIKVSGSATISISSGAPPAYPNEIAGVRHPVFGGRGTARPEAPWVLNQHRPFLAPAADMKADAAAEQFSKVIEDWAKDYGFK